jgi:hypothetical protein
VNVGENVGANVWVIDGVTYEAIGGAICEVATENGVGVTHDCANVVVGRRRQRASARRQQLTEPRHEPKHTNCRERPDALRSWRVRQTPDHQRQWIEREHDPFAHECALPVPTALSAVAITPFFSAAKILLEFPEATAER